MKSNHALTDISKEFSVTQEPLVSALVSTYNSERFMRACLEDLEAQTIRDRLEIIIIDSGSQQNERAIVESFQKKYSNIIYQRTSWENSHVSFNRAIATAHGKYVTMANTDDRHHSEAFAKMVSVFESDPGVGVVYHDSAITYDINTTLEGGPIVGRLRWPNFNRNRLFQVCYIGPQAMWRKSLNDIYGGFDPEFFIAGDYELWLRLSDKTRFQHIPEILGLYLENPESNEHKNHERAYKESELARQRHWNPADGPRPAPGGNYLERYTPEAFVGKEQQFPLVSVIVPTYNRPEELKCALRSIVGQSYPNIQVIVVNDGGMDVSNLVTTYPGKLKIIYQAFEKNKGTSAARNRGIQLAEGKYIAFLDDDDTFRPEHLCCLVSELDNNRTIVAAYTDALQITWDLTGPRKVISSRHVAFSQDFDPDLISIRNYIPMLCLMVQHEALSRAGEFNETMPALEDWEWITRLSRAGSFKHLPMVTAEYAVRQGAKSRNILSPKQIQMLYQFIYTQQPGFVSSQTRLGQKEFYTLMTGRNLEEDAPKLFGKHPEAKKDPAQVFEHLLAADDLPAALQEYAVYLDQDLLSLVKINAANARTDGEIDLAEGLDALAGYIEDHSSLDF